MHEAVRKYIRIWGLGFAVVSLAGCGEDSPEEAAESYAEGLKNRIEARLADTGGLTAAQAESVAEAALKNIQGKIRSPFYGGSDAAKTDEGAVVNENDPVSAGPALVDAALEEIGKSAEGLGNREQIESVKAISEAFVDSLNDIEGEEGWESAKIRELFADTAFAFVENLGEAGIASGELALTAHNEVQTLIDDMDKGSFNSDQKIVALGAIVEGALAAISDAGSGADAPDKDDATKASNDLKALVIGIVAGATESVAAMDIEDSKLQDAVVIVARAAAGSVDDMGLATEWQDISNLIVEGMDRGFEQGWSQDPASSDEKLDLYKQAILDALEAGLADAGVSDPDAQDLADDVDTDNPSDNDSGVTLDPPQGEDSSGGAEASALAIGAWRTPQRRKP